MKITGVVQGGVLRCNGSHTSSQNWFGFDPKISQIGSKAVLLFTSDDKMSRLANEERNEGRRSKWRVEIVA